MRLVWILRIFHLALPVHAEDVVLGLSKARVAITATFDRSEIFVFGAVKRETAIPETPLQVIVTIAGSYKPTLVRRKGKRFGIWINTESTKIEAAPSFYGVATSAPWDEVITAKQDAKHQVSVARAI